MLHQFTTLFAIFFISNQRVLIANETKNILTYIVYTGYFVEKNIPDAKVLIDRKLALVGKSIEAVEKTTSDKRKTLDKIVQFIQYKVAMANEQKAAAEAKTNK